MSLPELMLILLVALLAFGPSKLPMLARHLAWAVKKAHAFRQQLSEMWQQQLKEAQLLDNTRKAQKADREYHQQQEPPADRQQPGDDV